MLYKYLNYNIVYDGVKMLHLQYKTEYDGVIVLQLKPNSEEFKVL